MARGGFSFSTADVFKLYMRPMLMKGGAENVREVSQKDALQDKF